MTKEVLNWFKKIEGWQQAVFVAVVIGVLTTGTAFTYQNISLPADNKRIDEIQNDVNQIKVYISNDAIEKAIEKKDIQITKEKLLELKEDMKNGFDEIKQLINMNYRITKNIDKNTTQ